MLSKNVTFLGYEIDNHGVMMDENRIQAISQYKIPKQINLLYLFNIMDS